MKYRWLGVAGLLLGSLWACAPQHLQTSKAAPVDALPEGPHSAAIAQWQLLLRDDTNNPDALFHLAEIYGQRFQTLGNQSDKLLAIEHGQKVLLARPEDFAAQTLLYSVYYSAVRRGQQDDVKPLEALYAKVPLALRKGFFPPALASYLRELDGENNPRNIAKEKQLLLQAIAQQPQNGLLHVQLARYFFEQNAPDLGFASLHQALRFEPENPDVLIALGESYRSRAGHGDCVYEHLDDIKTSVQFLKQAMARKPQGNDVHFGLMINYAHLGLAPLSLREGDIWMAQMNPTQLANGPQLAQQRSTLAIFNAYQGQPQRAAELFQQAALSTGRGYVEYLMLQRRWQDAAAAFPSYVQSLKQPGVLDLMMAAIIQGELANDKVGIDDLWRTDKKAVFYSPWDQALAKYWRGASTEMEFKSAATNVCESADYEFYVGYSYVLHNRLSEAKAHFEKARGYALPMNFESRLAETFLQSF